ncbi:hypothetical protein BO78DRAFT_71907 [Aspergillus sclerotiicarbonarius CBS 121057]|uniref:Uncharacterized protein n=1 Tax=Aspergillus sclerotiicarbonarius (strain CBS 121057 / IBT 28362) TaxID=1448318 RepID=A0A319ENS8_ASPSB|nr:hypothetical protein BO78DRAFT_71907 [Aspergillus sclerotiicarbonarius CBS 121057]
MGRWSNKTARVFWQRKKQKRKKGSRASNLGEKWNGWMGWRPDSSGRIQANSSRPSQQAAAGLFFFSNSAAAACWWRGAGNPFSCWPCMPQSSVSRPNVLTSLRPASLVVYKYYYCTTPYSSIIFILHPFAHDHNDFRSSVCLLPPRTPCASLKREGRVLSPVSRPNVCIA